MVLSGVRVALVSRCAWTLFNFRRSLIKEILKEGGSVTALGASVEGYGQRLLAEGIQYEHIPVGRTGISPLSDIALFFILWRHFRLNKPDIVHAFTIKPVIYATLAAACARVPSRIVTITGLGYAFTTGSSALLTVIRSLYRSALRFAHVVFFQNRDDMELFLRYQLVSKSKVKLISGSGVDVAAFAPVPLPYRSSGLVTFIMIARLIWEKGVREYIAAAKSVKVKFPNTRFLLLGGLESNNPTALTESERLELRNSAVVEWIDKVVDVRPYIEAADVVVLPSYREGLPRALLEGAAMGRALLTTDAVGCREVVEDGVNGFVVPVGDVQALAEAMVKFLVSPTRIDAMGANARRMVEQRFDERSVIGETLDTYLEVLHHREAQ